MGIKGIFGEIGPGERIALSKLAIEHFEESGSPLRIAIDVSIWQFQTQSGQGGTNPAIRTFYYRLLRLLSASVQPLFVFDGPHKPKFKRNKNVGHGGGMVSNLMTKQMLNLFGFPFHMAPGEAEAECALLQKEGIVDAVLSEDVDTLMFGCGTTLKNWSSEGTKGNKTPTHVSLYDAKATKEGKSKLDREGMILVALMSGGDYITEGIPGCGIKVACEAARAGYGKSLCQISRSDDAAFEAWRTDLAHEVQTNQSNHFRVKHRALQIPADFPNKEVLGYYTHPVVSSSSKILKLKKEIVWDGEIDVQGLRVFVADAFEWINKIGAIKFIRGLAPVLLVQRLRVRGDRRASGYGDMVLTKMNEMELVRSICGQRVHISTDGMQELRVVYHPNDIVKLDLDAEPDDSEDYGRDGLAPVHDDDHIEAYASDERSTTPTKRGPSQYDPTQPDKLWILRSIVKVGVPLAVEDYEESVRNPKKPAKKPAKPKAPPKKAATKGRMQKGAMDRFVKVTKPTKHEDDTVTSKSLNNPSPASEMSPVLPPTFLAPSLEHYSPPQLSLPPPARKTRASTTSTTSSTKLKSRRGKAGQALPAILATNPWSQSQPSTVETSITKATTIKSTQQNSKRTPQKPQPQKIFIDLLSSPEQPRSTHKLSTPKKHAHPPTPSSAEEDLPPLPDTVTKTRGSQKVPKSESTLLTPSSLDKPGPRKKRSPSPSEFASKSDIEVEQLPIPRKLDFRSSSELPDLSEIFTTGRNSSFGVGQVDDESSRLEENDPSEEILPPLHPSPANSQNKENAHPPSPSLPRQTYCRPPKKINQFIDLCSSPPPALSITSSRLNTSFSSTTSFNTSTQMKIDSNSSFSMKEEVIESENKRGKADVKKKKKTHLLLRESIGMFQELDEEGVESQREKDRRKAGRGRLGKERVVMRYSEVECLDLTDV